MIRGFAGRRLVRWRSHIRYLRSAVTTLKAPIDGAIYAALTASLLAWVWRGA